jgi:hypothetical protein
MTMKLIQTKTITTTGISFIGFSSLDLLNFTDLYFVASVRSARAVAHEQLVFYINSDGGQKYANRVLVGNGSSVSSNIFSEFAGSAGLSAPGSLATASTFGSISMYLPNFKSTTNKVFSVDTVSENNDTTAYQSLIANRYTSTSPVSIISINNNQGNFEIGTTVSLYGITKGSDGIVTTS